MKKHKVEIVAYLSRNDRKSVKLHLSNTEYDYLGECLGIANNSVCTALEIFRMAKSVCSRRHKETISRILNENTSTFHIAAI